VAMQRIPFDICITNREELTYRFGVEFLFGKKNNLHISRAIINAVDLKHKEKLVIFISFIAKQFGGV
jgi:hypothetical protein